MQNIPAVHLERNRKLALINAKATEKKLTIPPNVVFPVTDAEREIHAVRLRADASA